MLLLWLKDHHIDKTNSHICMEATGVYSQVIAYYLLFAGFPVSVEPPLKVKRAFDPVGHKTDPVDSKQIARIDKELSKLIKQDPQILQKANHLKSIRGYGMLLAAHLLVITENFTKIQKSKRLASFVGIVPYQNKSGASVFKRAKIRYFGPGPSRKLLRLAAQSVATHDVTFRGYYLRKLAQGKANKALVLNNIVNKLLKVACAMVRNNTRYIKEHRSIHPMYLKSA